MHFKYHGYGLPLSRVIDVFKARASKIITFYIRIIIFLSKIGKTVKGKKKNKKNNKKKGEDDPKAREKEAGEKAKEKQDDPKLREEIARQKASENSS